jgi:hypothetical protein
MYHKGRYVTIAQGAGDFEAVVLTTADDWVKDRTLSRQAGFHGRRDCVGDYIKELRRKLGSAFSYEVRGQRWGRSGTIRATWLKGQSHFP